MIRNGKSYARISPDLIEVGDYIIANTHYPNIDPDHEMCWDEGITIEKTSDYVKFGHNLFVHAFDSECGTVYYKEEEV